jgi:hypothetical protein
MPKKLELKLQKEAKKKFGCLKCPRSNAYVYGTLRKTGWKPSTQLNKRRRINGKNKSVA